MTIRKDSILIIIAVCLLALIPAMQAVSEDNPVNVIYQTSFASDPHWITNNPSTNFWNPNLGTYNFSIEPSTGGYDYTIVNYERGSFTLDYDIFFSRIDDGATFRFGLTGNEMDLSKAPNVLSEFNNGKFGQIMWLHLVTPGSKLMEVNSQNGDTLSSGPSAYSGPTVKYDLNKIYHVTINYDDDHKTLSMTVQEKITGKEIWGYYLNTAESLNGMTRLYLGSVGDYGIMNKYAVGYIDNIRLTAPAEVTTAPTMTPGVTKVTINQTQLSTPQQTTALSTQIPSTTPASPSAGVLAIAALGVTCVFVGLAGKKKE